MSDVKKIKTNSVLNFVIVLILLIVPLFLMRWYEKSAFNEYSAIVSSLNISQDTSYAIRTITQIYSRNLIDFLIMPAFIIAGLSLFTNYVYSRRINYLETELKEIKEKLDA